MNAIRLFPRALIFGWLLAFAGTATAVQLSAPGVSGPPGGVVAAPISFSDVSDAPTVVVLHLDFDSAVCTPVGGKLNGSGADGEKVFDWNVVDNHLYAIVYSLNTAISADNVLTLYFKIAATAPAGTSQVTFTGGSASDQAEHDLSITFAGFGITVAALSGTHDSDTDASWTISLSEVLRIIQFFNSGGLHCQAGTEDRFAPGAGDQTCAVHDSDYFPQNWKIGLSEVLRVIQFYNFVSGSYHPDVNGEDGYAAGPF